MASVGNYLRELRQGHGRSLAEISRATRVASRYLEALEGDEFSALPAPVFTRGFIRAYCNALGEAPDEALVRYEHRDGLTSPPRSIVVSSPPPASTADSEGRTRGAIVVSAVLVVILGIALFGVAVMTQPTRDEQVAPATEQAAAPAAPPTATAEPSRPTGAPSSAGTGAFPPSPLAAVTSAPPTVSPVSPPAARPSPPVSSLPAPSSSSTPSSALASPGAGAEPPPATPAPPWLPNVQAATGGVSSPYRLVARVSEATWIRVRTDDGRTTEETIPAGETREWVSNRPFVLTLGNAGGVTLELNGRTLPPLGPSGAVISRIVLPPQ